MFVPVTLLKPFFVYVNFQYAKLKSKTLSIQSIADKCWKIYHD